MINVSQGWNENQKNLKLYLSNQKTFIQGINLLLEMHGLLHTKKVYNRDQRTFLDELYENLKEETCRVISNRETSIVWNIWHITRIEDIVSNIFIGNKETIFNKEIQTKLNINIKDTGNAMTYPEIESFSKTINITSLKEYRNNVGKNSQRIIKELDFFDIKRKVEEVQLEKVYKDGGVINNPNSKWLLDFWGKKNILGLIMMPITRHQVVHLNGCFKIKQKHNQIQRKISTG